MRVIMTGGGTGGHIYPAIAIADKIKEKHPDAEILFVGTERGLEKKLVPQSGNTIKFI
jgi:UDP-N-acetylglucosamine--N-acetylmuramyl-(pentapeptide) pyrophosphoryl-undecaprenol N-acetylglucosamine transferase